MNYIANLRKLVGHETIFTVGCGVIIEKEDRILLQHRTDEDNWCIPGGVMEIGESFEQAAKRETYEETGLEVDQLTLFGIYSGNSCFVQYPNGDQVYSVQIIFITSKYKGEIKQQGPESKEHRFFKRNHLPENLNPRQAQFILHWAEGRNPPIIS